MGPGIPLAPSLPEGPTGPGGPCRPGERKAVREQAPAEEGREKLGPLQCHPDSLATPPQFFPLLSHRTPSRLPKLLFIKCCYQEPSLVHPTCDLRCFSGQSHGASPISTAE